MKVQPIKAFKYGFTVWENPTLEELRRDECLCLHCSKLKPGQPDNCHIAARLFAVIVDTGVASPLSRCPEWEPKA